jgi:protein OS-9
MRLDILSAQLITPTQYEVIISDNVITEEHAKSALQAMASRHHGSQTTNLHTEPHPTPESSLHRLHDSKNGGETHLRLDDDILSYEDMTLNDRRYLCSIPRIPDTEAAKNSTKTSPEDEEKELARATSRGWELLKSMEGNCLYFYSGWWSYSFCYGQGVRQFHQLPPGKGIPIYPPVEDKNVDAYVLGKYEDAVGGGKPKSLDGGEEGKTGSAGSADSSSAEKETGLAKLETKGEMRYLVQKLGGGTTCDLTGKERRIEVQVRAPSHFHRKQTNRQSSSAVNPIRSTKSLSSRRQLRVSISWSSTHPISATMSRFCHHMNQSRTP